MAGKDKKRGDPVAVLRFPKKTGGKRRKKHKNSILHLKNGTCYLCMKLSGDYTYHWYLEEHHIFGGPNRVHSEAEGLKVYLCQECHRGRNGVHMDREKMDFLHREGQKAYEKTHTRDQFMQLIGRNYLEK